MASIESVISEVAELLGHDKKKIDVETKLEADQTVSLVIILKDIDEDDYNDTDDGLDDDDE